jgi:hypothetical protein
MPDTSNNSDFFAREKEIRLGVVRDEIAGRLRKGCGYLGDADFALLVDDMARVQIRTEIRNQQQSDLWRTLSRLERN